MLTGFTMAVPIWNKNAETICDTYRDHIYCTFRGSSRILTDNGSEFKNQEMRQVCEILGVKHIFSPVYTPESNGCLEGWYRFFKACITKHIRGGGVEWDELVPLAVSVYNFFPCQSSKESPFVLMFGRDRITPVAKLLEPKPRYYREKGSTLKMDMLRRLYTIMVENIHKAREKKPKINEEKKQHSFMVNDMVLVKDPDSAVFEPRYQSNYRVTAIFRNNRIEVQDEKGHRSVRRSSHVKYVEPSEKVIRQLPSRELLQNYGRSSKLLIAAKDIPNLHLNVEDTEDTSEFCEQNPPEGIGEVVEIMESNELSQNVSETCTDRLWISEDCKHLRNSLRSAAGTALLRIFQDRLVKSTQHTEMQGDNRKDREHSRNSLVNVAGVTLQTVTKRNGIKETVNRKQWDKPRKSSEHSRKSWSSEVGVVVGPTDEVITAIVKNRPIRG